MRKCLIFGLVAVLGLIGCSRNQEIDVPDANLSIFARTESPTESRTIVESGVHVYWEPGDEIAVFMGEKSAKFTTDITAASGTATFKGTFGDQGWPEELDLWAVYPFSEDATFDGETITTVLPSEQVAREGSFGKDMNLAIAHSSGTTLQFYNVGGGIRFSVTEEGIKKVMFEGLSGEIISGKVKIGMDENGKPVVQEVTGGSQFITLLPPSGQETFKPGAWYYIVAIPGSLEGGYKLRFYKDTDYARKVTEKRVEIKRSIFGSLEKADKGIEFEAQTTHYPETDQEWELSYQQTSIIKNSWDHIATEYLFNADSLDADCVISEVAKIDGIIDVKTKGATVVVTQKDGVIINIFLDAYNKKAYSDSEQPTLSASTRLASKSHETFNNGKKALILSPFASIGLNGLLLPEKLASIRQAFLDMGFTKVSVLKDNQAGIEQFYGDSLSEYDVILFSTHGGIGEHTTVEGTTVSTTTIVSSTVYNPDNFKMCTKYNPAIGFVPGQTFKDYIYDCIGKTVESTPYLCMTPSFLDGLDNNAFNNDWIHFESCHSADIDETGSRPLMKAFVDKGASIVTGYYGEILTKVIANPMTLDLIADLGGGLSFDEAFSLEDTGIRKNSCFPWVVDSPYYLVNPYPTDLKKTDISDNEIEFSWYQAPNLGTYSYDVFLNGELIKTTFNKSIKYKGTLKKENKWYVVANLLEFNLFSTKIWASYQSEEKTFTVKEDPIIPYSESVDLGLPSGTKWARYNVGASSPEEYGDHFAWGETEPKELYTWENYKWCNGTQNSLIKYCYNSEYGYNGFTDNLMILLPEDDAASVKWGGYWRMPTKEESWELSNNTTISLVEHKGVKVFEVKSKINGNVIYFPIAGYRDYEEYQYTGILDGGEYRGFYWCSDIDSYRAYDGYNFCLSNDSYTGFSDGCSFGVYTHARRNRGYTIRPVYK